MSKKDRQTKEMQDKMHNERMNSSLKNVSQNTSDTTKENTIDDSINDNSPYITDRKVDEYYSEQPVNDFDTSDDSIMNEDRNEALEIPFEYESIIEQITEAVFNGYICFLNPETLEIEQVADEATLGMDGMEISEQNEDMIDEFGLSYTQWDSYIRFEPFSREDMMDKIDLFRNNIDDQKLKSQLDDFLDEEELFNQFPDILERTGYTIDWNIFLRNEIESYVKGQISETMRRHTDSNNEIYDV